jgi:hypothetical protein
MCKALLGDIVYLSPLEEPEKGPYSMEVPTNLVQTNTIGGENEDFGGRSFIPLEIHPTIWSQKATLTFL